MKLIIYHLQKTREYLASCTLCYAYVDAHLLPSCQITLIRLFRYEIIKLSIRKQ